MPLKVETFSPAEPYNVIHARMLALVEARLADDIGDTVLIGEHPPVITCGRKTNPANILNPQGIPVVAIERGGDVTWHGPGQLVIYPILKLEGPQRDLHAYLRGLEQLVIDVLGECGVVGFRHKLPGQNTTGVWVTDAATDQPRKIASIGVAVRRWVTYHGISLNVTNDLAVYQAINPCGFGAEVMTNLITMLR